MRCSSHPAPLGGAEFDLRAALLALKRLALSLQGASVFHDETVVLRVEGVGGGGLVALDLLDLRSTAITSEAA